jgi:AraC-like DNA-binding protein
VSLSRRVLAKHLEHAGLPSPQRLLTWGRLIVAAHMLEDPHRSADGVAQALHFPSGSAFRNTCQRYLEATPSEIRSRGGAAYAVAMMRSGADEKTGRREDETTKSRHEDYDHQNDHEDEEKVA